MPTNPHFFDDCGPHGRGGGRARLRWRRLCAVVAVALVAASCSGAESEAADREPVLLTSSTSTTAVRVTTSTVPVAQIAAPATSVVPVTATAVEGAVDADGNRLLAGDDRYETAVLLAEVPIMAGNSMTDNVVVVSGESLVDAVSVVSLAASRDATVVLTETGGLPGVLRSFVSEQRFSSATVGGGDAAVSADAERELAALLPARATSVERVEGATRYETAVNAARAAGEPGVWCDGRSAAVLVSGDSLVDGVIAAPVAYAMGLPLLFVRPDGLPDAVGDYLADASVERAVIVGSPADVSGSTLAQLGTAGVATVAFDAPTPAARSVELAEAMADCATQQIAAGEYALLDANQPVDGVAAAAALATGLGSHSDSGDLIPILAVNQNSLPAEVANYLAAVGEMREQIILYPLGGKARITQQVIDLSGDASGGATVNDDGATTSGGGAAVVAVPDFAATEDLDGDGELSYDELYPADTPHRDAYLEVSDGVAPPGAFAPPVPDLLEVAGGPRRSELSLGRSSHDRFPNGFPLPPGAPDYATTTFDERQQLRADAFAAYAKPDPNWGAPRNTARGQWDSLYDSACGHVQQNRNMNNGRVATLGFETFPCEWLTDWNIWQCDVLNDPAVTRLAPHEQWTELTLRYYDLVVDLVGRDRFYLDNSEMATLTTSFLASTQYGLRGFWEGRIYVNGLNYCAFRIDDQPTAANETFHNQQVEQMHDHFSPNLEIHAALDADQRVRCGVWLTRNSWYVQRDPAAPTRFC